MLLCIFPLSFFTVQYLADATPMTASYLKVQKLVTILPVNVTIRKVRSLIECGMKCLNSNGLCFSYDDALQECGLGNCLSPNTIIGATQEFFVSCNSNEGFQLFTSGFVAVCIFVSNTTANYANARNDCQARSAQLYTIKTIDKLNILGSNVPTKGYWIGLNDIEVENMFRWQDDNTICDDACRAQIFPSGQPDNYGNEDCVYYASNFVLDGFCYVDLGYICEKKFL